MKSIHLCIMLSPLSFPPLHIHGHTVSYKASGRLYLILLSSWFCLSLSSPHPLSLPRRFGAYLSTSCQHKLSQSLNKSCKLSQLSVHQDKVTFQWTDFLLKPSLKPSTLSCETVLWLMARVSKTADYMESLYKQVEIGIIGQKMLWDKQEYLRRRWQTQRELEHHSHDLRLGLQFLQGSPVPNICVCNIKKGSGMNLSQTSPGFPCLLLSLCHVGLPLGSKVDYLKRKPTSMKDIYNNQKDQHNRKALQNEV